MSTPTAASRQPPPKKLRATVDLDAPGIANDEDVWTAPPSISEKSLTTAESLFGDDWQWFVRPSYVKLYDDIMADKKRKHTQIVNGTAGIGKSSFLLYALARCRCAGKSVLLHYHRTDKERAIPVFFPANGKPLLMNTSSPSYLETFRKCYKQIGIEESLFLVGGIVSYTKDDFRGVTYVTAKSPSCSIGFMEKDQNRCDRWLEFWTPSELLTYATIVGIPNAAEIIRDNWRHLGGVSRYAFTVNYCQRCSRGSHERYFDCGRDFTPQRCHDLPYGGSTNSRGLSTDLFTDMHLKARLESMALHSRLRPSLSQRELPWLFVLRQTLEPMSSCAALIDLVLRVACVESCSRHTRCEDWQLVGNFS